MLETDYPYEAYRGYCADSVSKEVSGHVATYYDVPMDDVNALM